VELSAQTRNELLGLARQVIVERLGRSESPVTTPANAELQQPAGSFVSLHEMGTHKLRGCVGTLEATRPLWESVRHTAAAVLEDPRFTDNPVTAQELSRLEIEISVLSPLRQTQDPLDFDPLNDGIYLTFGQRAGCFLPQVARETGWTKEQLLDRLCLEKLALPAPTWRHPDAKLGKFSVTLIGPEPFQ
jgi:uncharacterized protein